MLKLIHYLLGSLIVIASATFVRAQDPHPFFKNYTVDDGLPSSEVYSVKQDREGYIWFATGNGVSRYNGYEFQNFSISDGLPDNTVFDLCEGADGKMWFVTISCKIGYYYKGRIHPFKYNSQLQKQLRSSNKTTFYVDHSETVHLGVEHDGLYSITKEGKISCKRHDYKKTLLVGRKGKEHLGFSSDIFFLGKTITIKEPGKTNSWTLPAVTKYDITPRTVIQTKKGTYLFGLGNYVASLHPNKKIELISYPEIINWIYEDRDKDLWLASYHTGVYRYQNGIRGKRQNYLNGYTVTCVFQDNEGGFWFTTYGNGVFYSPTKKILNYDSGCGLKDNDIIQLATDRKHIFIAAKNGYIHSLTNDGISIFNSSLIPGVTNQIANMRYVPGIEELWIYGYKNHLRIRQGKKNSDFVCYFHDLLFDKNGMLWIAQSSCLMKADLKSETAKVLYPNNKHLRINALASFPASDKLYFGGIDGLWKMNLRDEKMTYLGGLSDCLQNRIMDLEFLSNGWLVIATKGVGVIFYKNGKTFQITEQNGLAGDNVYKLFVRGNSVWAATNKGLAVLNIPGGNPKKCIPKKISVLDGLVSNELNDIVIAGNTVWVSSSKGVSSFQMNRFKDHVPPTPVYVNKISINDKPIQLKKKYRLQHNENNIKIAFTGISFRNAANTRYRYKMKGLNDNWMYTTNRELQYTTLPPNNYTLIVSAQNQEGKWGPPFSCNFDIVAPFWTTWWFILLEIAVGITLFTAILRYRFSVQRKNEVREAQLNKELSGLKLKALRAQMNPHFTFNVINSIQHYILHADVESAYRYLSMFSRLIRSILSNSEKESISVAEELKTLELYLELETMRFENRFDYNIDIHPEIDVRGIEIPSMLIQPFVENSIKHGILPSGRKGRIDIRLSLQNKHLKCAVTDNGIGRKAAALNSNKDHTSFGSKLTHERLSVINSLHQHTISETITDLYDEHGTAIGTHVELFIPLP